MANKQRADPNEENLNLELLYQAEKQRADEAEARYADAENDLDFLKTLTGEGMNDD